MTKIISSIMGLGALLVVMGVTTQVLAGDKTKRLSDLSCTAGQIPMFDGTTWVCHPPRFVDNGNGTITDNQTGLMWEKKLADTDVGGKCDMNQPDRSIHCVNNIYNWSTGTNNPDGTLFTDFLARINTALSTSDDGINVANVCFAGHCDWRIPNIAELGTILAACPGAGNPCIDPIFGPTSPGNQSWYWSSTKGATFFPSSAWTVNFGFAFKSNQSQFFPAFVRAVRGGS